MAYTSSPSESTYSSEKIDLIKTINSRLGALDKDVDYMNVFTEIINDRKTGDKEANIYKRAGSTGLLANVASGTVRGSWYWEDQQSLYYCVANVIYIYNFGTATATSVTPFTSTSGTVGFAEFIFDNGTTALIFSDGTTLGQLSTSNVVTLCVDADLPTPHDPNILFIDGYIVVAKLNTSGMYNSDNNVPLSWTSTNFIDTEIEAATIVRLFKVSNYIVAATKETLEYFWDAGVATGSPFQRNDTPVKKISYLSAAATEGNITYFVGKDFNGDFEVYKLYDFKCDPVGTPTLSRYLNTLSSSNYTAWRGNIVAYQGHRFYVLSAGSKTYCMDLDTGLWSRLGYQTSTTFDLLRSHGMRTSTGNTSMFCLNNGTSTWFKFDETLYQDSSVNFTCTIVTDSTDFGTLNRKNMSRLSLYADRPPVDSALLIQWTDDDYQTYNTGISTNLNQDLQCIRQLGNFRQRAFKLTHSDNTLLRIQGMVADINKGST